MVQRSTFQHELMLTSTPGECQRTGLHKVEMKFICIKRKQTFTFWVFIYDMSCHFLIDISVNGRFFDYYLKYKCLIFSGQISKCQ